MGLKWAERCAIRNNGSLTNPVGNKDNENYLIPELDGRTVSYFPFNYHHERKIYPYLSCKASFLTQGSKRIERLNSFQFNFN
jgi:hypothetical protein